jgi:hypothetical protein
MGTSVTQNVSVWEFGIDFVTMPYPVFGNGTTTSARVKFFPDSVPGVELLNYYDTDTTQNMFYTKEETESLIENKDKNTVGQYYKENDEIKGEIFNDYDNNKAIGEYSHAEGNNTQALGEGSHAEGIYTKASVIASHAEGNNTQALGEGSHAEGNNTKALENFSHSEGSFTVASNYNAHAEGYNTQALGEQSHAEGETTQALGKASHTEGVGTHAVGDYQHVQGRYNIADVKNSEYLNGKYAHIVGNGDIDNPSNAHTLDWDGNAWFAGDVTVGENNDKLVTEKEIDDKIQELKDSGEIDGKDGVSMTHSWDGTILTVTSASGSSSSNLKGEVGPQGPQGIQGNQGEDGYTPVRGVDYWTDEDKMEIKNYVDNAILGGSW